MRREEAHLLGQLNAKNRIQIQGPESHLLFEALEFPIKQIVDEVVSTADKIYQEMIDAFQHLQKGLETVPPKLPVANEGSSAYVYNFPTLVINRDNIRFIHDLINFVDLKVLYFAILTKVTSLVFRASVPRMSGKDLVSQEDASRHFRSEHPDLSNEDLEQQIGIVSSQLWVGVNKLTQHTVDPGKIWDTKSIDEVIEVYDLQGIEAVKAVTFLDKKNHNASQRSLVDTIEIMADTAIEAIVGRRFRSSETLRHEDENKLYDEIKRKIIAGAFSRISLNLKSLVTSLGEKGKLFYTLNNQHKN